jgi:hypothetical protein
MPLPIAILAGTSLVALAIYLGLLQLARAISRIADGVPSLSPKVTVHVDPPAAQQGERPPQPRETTLPDSVLSEIASIKSEGFSKGGSASREASEFVAEDSVSSVAAGLRRAKG